MLSDRRSPIDLRRAVLGLLLSAGRPMTVTEVVEHVRASGFDPNARRVANLLAYQMRAGRVVRRGPATYSAIAEAMSGTTRWRCLNWDRLSVQRPDLGGVRSSQPRSGLGPTTN